MTKDEFLAGARDCLDWAKDELRHATGRRASIASMSAELTEHEPGLVALINEVLAQRQTSMRGLIHYIETNVLKDDGETRGDDDDDQV